MDLQPAPIPDPKERDRQGVFWIIGILVVAIGGAMVWTILAQDPGFSSSDELLATVVPLLEAGEMHAVEQRIWDGALEGPTYNPDRVRADTEDVLFGYQEVSLRELGLHCRKERVQRDGSSLQQCDQVVEFSSHDVTGQAWLMLWNVGGRWYFQSFNFLFPLRSTDAPFLYDHQRIDGVFRGVLVNRAVLPRLDAFIAAQSTGKTLSHDAAEVGVVADASSFVSGRVEYRGETLCIFTDMVWVPACSVLREREMARCDGAACEEYAATFARLGCSEPCSSAECREYLMSELLVPCPALDALPETASTLDLVLLRTDGSSASIRFH